MRRPSLLLALSLPLLFGPVSTVFAATPQPGQAAPDFRLQDQNGHWRTPADYRIDPQGKVAKVYEDVDPEKNSAQVLGDLASLKAGS
ncbi:hypothetical protein ACO2Q2_07405 [Dyella sp. KRB-257]|uniref:hypothetical protein n=1 Tax=Dyella sp. KRB-257 TaxID=3400915 RepID=UPI003C0F1928